MGFLIKYNEVPNFKTPVINTNWKKIFFVHLLFEGDHHCDQRCRQFMKVVCVSFRLFCYVCPNVNFVHFCVYEDKWFFFFYVVLSL